MKTFEEKWTAWVDDELSDTERAEFEASLDDRVAAEVEKRQTHKLRALLKEELQPRAMGNEEFFHHQLRARIADGIEATRDALCATITRELVDDSPFALDRRVVTRRLCHLYLFRSAREASSRSVAVSYSNPERAG